MKAVITERDVPLSGDLTVAAGTIITPSARDLARNRGVKIVEVPKDQFKPSAPPEKVIAIGSDHGGYRMKEALKPLIEELGLISLDVGVDEEKPVDYPDIAEKVGEAILKKNAGARRDYRRRGHRIGHGSEQNAGHPRSPML